MKLISVFRHEYKYVIPYDEFLSLRKKLDDLLEIDRDYNGYMIRSLYFDSIEDNDYYEKLGGELVRKKIRLRIYDLDKDFVKLEMKKKQDIHQNKISIVIDRKDANEIMNENYSCILKYDNEAALSIYTILMSGVYKPKVIIEYNRIAYVSKMNTRITFDMNIKSSNDISKFFNKDVNYTELTNKSDVVMEVKFDRLLEPYISSILKNYVSRGQSISKYVIGRNV